MSTKELKPRNTHMHYRKVIFLLLAVGIISTLVMDLGGAAFRATGITSGVPPQLIGKWIDSAMSGKVFVDDIRTSEGELVPTTEFLLYHYAIGIALTFLFYFLLSLLKMKSPPWWVPVTYGLATTAIPAFLMFPAMGFGVMGMDGPAEYKLFLTAIINHLFFGIGLMLAYRWLFKKSGSHSVARLEVG